MSSILTETQQFVADAIKGLKDGGFVEICTSRTNGRNMALAVLAISAAMLNSSPAVAAAAEDGRLIVRDASQMVQDSAKISRNVMSVESHIKNHQIDQALNSFGFALGTMSKYEPRPGQSGFGPNQAGGHSEAYNRAMNHGKPANVVTVPQQATVKAASYSTGDQFMHDFGMK